MAGPNRSRTGCLTCRKRKLKCDETKPVCKNCQKSNRPCEPAPVIAFRNQQNPSLNSEEGAATGIHNLRNFYKYAESFGTDNVWVPTPSPIQFVYITDPYADEPTASTSGYSTHPPISRDASIPSMQQNTYSQVVSTTSPTLTNNSYQDLASHSLHALSHAATSQTAPFASQEGSVAASWQPVRNPGYSSVPPAALPEHPESSGRRTGGSEKAGLSQTNQEHAQGQDNGINSPSNPSSAVATAAAAAARAMANIDPDLERIAVAVEQGAQHTEKIGAHETPEEQLAKQLREVTEQD